MIMSLCNYYKLTVTV